MMPLRLALRICGELGEFGKGEKRGQVVDLTSEPESGPPPTIPRLPPKGQPHHLYQHPPGIVQLHSTACRHPRTPSASPMHARHSPQSAPYLQRPDQSAVPCMPTLTAWQCPAPSLQIPELCSLRRLGGGLLVPSC